MQLQQRPRQDIDTGWLDAPPDDHTRRPSHSDRRLSAPDIDWRQSRPDERLACSDATNMSLLRCRLVTGRRHQIRVHLAARGWPVVGDAVYGRALHGFPRHALHAWRVALVHPIDATSAGERGRR